VPAWIRNHSSSRYAASALHAHLAFVTKYRRGVLTADHIYVRKVFTKACENLGAPLADCNGGDDHVHLLAGYPP
jgi:putative transposase